MQRLYDANMRLIGYYVQDAAGRVRALDSDSRLVGSYDPFSDKTYDKNRTLVGRGNLLASLLPGGAKTGGE